MEFFGRLDILEQRSRYYEPDVRLVVLLLTALAVLAAASCRIIVVDAMSHFVATSLFISGQWDHSH
jgi:hypothetical protein